MVALLSHTGDMGPWLTIQVGATAYGLPLPAVVEVVRAVALDRMPEGVNNLAGLCSYRGRPIACLHLRAVLDNGSAAVRLSDRLVVLRIGRNLMGLLVDDALGVVTAAAAMPFGPSGTVPYVRGALEVDHRLILVLDPQALAEHWHVPFATPALADPVQ